MNWNPTSPNNLATDEKPKAIVLLSGGLDSTVALALLREKADVIMALTLNYGQNAYGREYKAAKAIAGHYDIPHQTIALPWLSELLPPSMQFKAFKPHTPQLRWQNEEGLPLNPEQVTDSVWIPNRNALFLNIAASYAEFLGAHWIAFGANADEAQNFPDNAPPFTEALNATLQLSTRLPVQVVTPVGHLTKAEMIALAVAMEIPLKLVWSCYESGQTPCHQCPSCRLLDKALSHRPQSSSQSTQSVLLQEANAH